MKKAISYHFIISLSFYLKLGADNSERVKKDRREQRFVLDSIILPFLGTRVEDNVCFQYLLVDISYRGFQISVPKWLISRSRMEEGALVDMHIPFLFNQRTFTQGKIVWSKWDERNEAQLCGIHLEEKGMERYPVFISLESKAVTLDLKNFESESDLLLKVLKDAFLLKRGVLIYLKHLISYFTRITDYPSDDYVQLKDVFLNDVSDKVRKNVDRLESLYENLKTGVRVREDIAANLDLEELRDMMESEIYLDIFKATYDTESILPYMTAIKLLENRLYLNYNTVVMIYIHSL